MNFAPFEHSSNRLILLENIIRSGILCVLWNLAIEQGARELARIPDPPALCSMQGELVAQHIAPAVIFIFKEVDEDNQMDRPFTSAEFSVVLDASKARTKASHEIIRGSPSPVLDFIFSYPNLLGRASARFLCLELYE